MRKARSKQTAARSLAHNRTSVACEMENGKWKTENGKWKMIRSSRTDRGQSQFVQKAHGVVDQMAVFFVVGDRVAGDFFFQRQFFFLVRFVFHHVLRQLVAPRGGIRGEA